MRNSVKFLLLGLMLSTLIVALPGQAQAARDAFRGDSFVNYITTTTTDTTLVPGGVNRFYLNTLGAFGVQGEAGSDTFVAVRVRFMKGAGVTAFTDIIDTVQLVLDANNNQIRDAGDLTIVASSTTPDSSGTDFARYALSGFTRVIGTGAESHVIVVHTKNNLLLADTIFSVLIDTYGVDVKPNPGSTSNLPSNGEAIQFASYQFKVYADSTGFNVLSNEYRHQDSAAGGSPITILHGTLQGETRTVGDSLAKFGVNFGGTAAAYVDSAWLLVGRPGAADIRVDLGVAGGIQHSWNAPVITTVPIAALGTFDTFRVVATVSYPPFQSTLSCTIPLDSVQTRFRHANTVVIGPSRTDTFTRPRVSATDSSLTNLVVFPDSQVTGQAPFLLAAGTIDADTLLTPQLANDTVNRFTVGLVLGGTMRHTDIESVAIEVDGDTITGVWIAGTDSWTAQFGTTASGFGLSTNFRVWVNLRETAPVNGTVRSQVPIDSIFTRFRDTGLSASLLGSRIVTVNRPRLHLQDSILPAINVHPDTRVTDSFVLATYSILPDSLLSTPLALDSVTRLATRLLFGGGLNATHIDTVLFIVNGRLHVTGSTGPDTYGIGYGGGLAETFTNGCSVTIFVKTNNNAPINGTVQAQIQTDSITTRWRLAGPSADSTAARIVTMLKPRVVLQDTLATSITVHPDTRLTDSFILMAGVLYKDTQLSTALPYDTLVSVTVSCSMAGGFLFSHIDTVILKLNDTFYVSTSNNGTDSFGFLLPNTRWVDTLSYAVYVRTNNNAPFNGQIRGIITTDSVVPVFRLAGPADNVMSARTVTIQKPRVVIADTLVTSISVHPDTRIQDSFTLMAGVLYKDTQLTPALAYDTLLRVTVSCSMSNGFMFSHIDTVLLQLNDTLYVSTGNNGTDSFEFLLPNTRWVDTIAYSVHVRTNNNAPINSQVRGIITTDSVVSVFRLAGPAESVMSARIVTMMKPQISIIDTLTTNLSVHPDTRVTDSFILMAGVLLRDTLLTPTMNDSIVSLVVRCSMTGTFAFAHIDTVLLQLNDTLYVSTGNDGIDSFSFRLPNAASWVDTLTYRVYVRTNNNAPVNGRIRGAFPATHSLSTYRFAGPSDTVMSARTVDIVKPQVAIVDTLTTHLSVHPDTRVTDSFILMAGVILRDTLLTPSLHDSFVTLSLRCSMANTFAFAHIDTILLQLNDTVYVSTGNDGIDSFTFRLPNAASWIDTLTYRVYVRTNNNAPVNGQIRGAFPGNHTLSTYRVSGPSDTVLSARTVTIVKPQVVIVDTLTTHLSVHPDTRVTDSFILMAGVILRDTLLTPSLHDSFVTLTLRCSMANTFAFAHIDTILLQLNDTVYVSTGNDGIDSFTFHLPNVSSWIDTLTYRVYVRTNNNAPVNGQIRGAFPGNHTLSRYRVSGPSDTVLSARTVTIIKPRIAMQDTLTSNINVHPDTRVTDSFILMAGMILRDTVMTPSLAYDTFVSLAVRCSMVGGFAFAHIDTMILRLNDTFYVSTGNNGNDSFTFHLPNAAHWTETIHYAVYVRTNNNAPINSQLRGYIPIDSAVSTFRLPGPSDTVLSARTVTFVKQQVIVRMATLANQIAHPDSRVQSRTQQYVVDSFIVASGDLRADSVSGIVADTLTQFGFRLALTGIHQVDIESVAVVINGETRTATNTIANLDSWYVAANKLVSDTISFRIYVTPRDSATPGSTIRAFIAFDSITTAFRDSGPRVDTSSTGILTCSKPILQVHSYVYATHVDSYQINPTYAATNPVLVLTSRWVLDSTLIITDSDRLGGAPNKGVTIVFYGTARDSITSVEINYSESRTLNGTWVTMVKTGTDTYFDSTSISIRTYDSIAVRIKVDSRAVMGNTIWAKPAAFECTGTYSTPGPGTTVDSSGVFTIATDPIFINMWNLGNIYVTPWAILDSNPFMVCSGVILTDSGNVIMPDYDTLTSFGIVIDSVPDQIQAASQIAACTLVLWASPAHGVTETIALVSDAANNRLWKLPVITDSRVTINKVQPFTVFIQLNDTPGGYRHMAGRDTYLFARIPRDSVNTTFTSGLGGETSSLRNVVFIFADTTRIVQNTTLADTSVNPDSRFSQNPFVLFGGRINGANASTALAGPGAQQWKPSAGDSLTYFGIRIFSAISGDFIADSVTSVTVLLSDSGRRIALTRGNFSPAVPLGDKIWHWSASTETPLLGPNNSDTFLVLVTVMDTVPLNTRLRAEIFSDSVSTLYQADSLPRNSVLGSRTVTLAKPTFSIAVTPLTDTTVSPFRQQNDSTLAMTGRFATTQTPTDSLVGFGVRLRSALLTGESFTLRMAFESGVTQPFYETTLVRVDNLSKAATYRLSAPLTIDSGQVFTIHVVTADSSLSYMGESITLSIPQDSAWALYSIGTAGNLTCSRLIRYNFIDTVLVTDSALSDTTIHPDYNMLMNPFVAWVGTVRGQISTSALRDTLQRLAFRFTGSATTGGDSISSAVVLVDRIDANGVASAGWDTFPLIRQTSTSWVANLDTQLPANSTIRCTLVVRAFDTIQLGSNLLVVMDPDSIHTFFANRPDSLVSASRLVTFNKPSFGMSADVLADTTVSPFRALNDSTLAMSGRITGAFSPYDTLSFIRVILTGSNSLVRESVGVVLRLNGSVSHDSEYYLVRGTDSISLANGGTSCSFYLQGPAFIETGMRYGLHIVPRETMTLMGRSMTITIDTATSSFFTGAASGLTSGRTIRWNYIDTVLITDSALVDTTVHPDSTAKMNPYIAMVFSIRGQTSASGVADALTAISVRFSGTAADSVLQTWLIFNGADTLNLSKTGSDTWAYTAASLDSAIPYGQTMACTLYVRVYETVTLGTTLNAAVPINGIRTYYTAGRETHTLAARTATLNKPLFGMAATLLPDTRVSPFPAQTDSVPAFAGQFTSTYTVTDTLMQFGVRLGGSNNLLGDSFAVFMQFLPGPTGVVAGSETQLVAVNPGLNLGQNVTFRLLGAVAIETGQRFVIHVRVLDTPTRYLGETLTVVIPPDSATAARVVGTQGNLTCSRIIYFNYVDTVQIVNGVLPDTNIHPDSRSKENPLIAMTFNLRGQTSAFNVGDTLRFITIRFEGTAVGTNDSVAGCSIAINGADSRGQGLTRLDTHTWRLTMDSTIVYNQVVSCTVIVHVFETVALNKVLRAVLDSGAVRTTLSAAVETATVGRWITLGKPAFAIATDQLTESSIVPVWRAQMESVLVMSGRISSSYSQTDSLVEFRVAFKSASPRLLGESLIMVFRRDSGPIGLTPTLDLAMTPIGTGASMQWAIPQQISVDTGQRWSVWATAYETPVLLAGETAIFFIPADSAYGMLSQGRAGNITCSHEVRWNYVDTVTINDSALANITVHPDSRMNQNPFVLFRGSIRGQRYKAGLDDTITRIAFRFNGTAVPDQGTSATAMDSVISAWIVVDTGSGIGPETKQLARVDSDAWGLTTTFKLPYAAGTIMQCTLYVRVFDSVALGATFFAEIPRDSVDIYYCNDTPLLAGDTDRVRLSRTVTFGVPTTTPVMDTIASQAWVHPVYAQALNPNYLRLRGQESNPIVIMSGLINGDASAIPQLAVTGDTLKSFQVNFLGTGAGGSHITACTLTLMPGLRHIALAQLTTAVGLETWGQLGLDTGFTAPDTTTESFYVTVRVSETIPQASTLFAQIPAHGLKTQYRDTGPGVAMSSGCTFTYRRDSMLIHTEVRRPWLSPVLEVRETREIMWFVPKSDVEADTLSHLAIRLMNTAGAAASIDAVTLYRDVNGNRRWDSMIIWPSSALTAGDSLVGRFVQTPGTDTWTLVHGDTTAFGSTDRTFKTDTQYQTTDTAEYLIVMRILDTGIVWTQAIVPALGADGWYTESGITIPVVSDTYYVGRTDDTAPISPANFTITVQAGAMVLAFEPSPSGDTEMLGGMYVLFFDSGLGQYPTAFLKTFAHVPGQLSYTYPLPDSTMSFVSDSAYRFVLVSQDSTGNKSAASPVVTAVFRSALAPAAAASVQIISPQAGDFVYDSVALANHRVNFVAKLADRLTAPLVTGVEFSYRRVTDTGTTFSVFALARDSSFDAAGEVYYNAVMDTTVTLLTYGAFIDSYEVRAVAITSAGRDTYASTISFVVVSDTRFATYVTLVGDSRAAADSSFLEQVVTTRANHDIVAMRTPTGAFDVVLKLNRGSIASDTARIVGMVRRNGIPDTFANALRAIGAEVLAYWAQFTLQQNSGDTALYGDMAQLTINYIDANNDGIDDSSFVDMTKAKIYSINGTGQAELLENITLDRNRRTLTATVKHFSPFFVTNDTGTNAAGLNRLIIGPNPYRPNDGNDQTGRPWVPGDATTGIMFKNLPNRVRIEIFTILGERVIEINKNDANATISWGAKNQDGRDVASGYYLYVVTDLGTGQRVTGKIAVIR